MDSSLVVGVELDGRRFEVTLLRPEPPHAELARRRHERSGAGRHHAAAREAVVSPMQGTVLAVEVAEGDRIADLLGEPRQLADEVDVQQIDRWIVHRRAADAVPDCDPKSLIVLVAHG